MPRKTKDGLSKQANLISSHCLVAVLSGNPEEIHNVGTIQDLEERRVVIAHLTEILDIMAPNFLGRTKVTSAIQTALGHLRNMIPKGRDEYEYRGLKVYRMTFAQPRLCDGESVTGGWGVSKDRINPIPGAGWFRTVTSAYRAIDTLLITGDSPEFHKLYNPKPVCVSTLVEALEALVDYGIMPSPVLEDLQDDAKCALDEYHGRVCRCEACGKLLYTIEDHAPDCPQKNTMVTKGSC